MQPNSKKLHVKSFPQFLCLLFYGTSVRNTLQSNGTSHDNRDEPHMESTFYHSPKRRQTFNMLSLIVSCNEQELFFFFFLGINGRAQNQLFQTLPTRLN